MSIERLPDKTERPGKETTTEIRKGGIDLVILQTMARKIVVTLHSLEQPAEVTLPLSYSFKERRGRQHRMIIFAPHELLTPEKMRFVGFVSNRKQNIEQHIIDGIFHTDELMLSEITRVPGLLSYSSLELRPGTWYNLVLFRDESVKNQVKHAEAHRHAVHYLSPAYYEWIRLHNGTLAQGLIHSEWQLKSTKHYRFPGSQQPPVVCELNYETCTDAC